MNVSMVILSNATSVTPASNSYGTFWADVQSGLITSIIFAVAVWGMQQLRYLFLLRLKIHNKEYDVYYKRYPEEKIMHVKCKTKGNRIKFEGTILINNKEEFRGEIIVNLINFQTGEGHHIQGNTDANTFFKVILSDDKKTFYIDAPYIAMKESSQTNDRGTYNKEGHQVFQAFVWKQSK